ncbi:MAG TPA: MFS transporter [Edaphobacter sp.]|jgi:ACS family hexuronate transporter-like MFS transporter
MRKLRHLRWYIAALLFASTVINYIDRQTIAVLKPRIMADLHLSQMEYARTIQGWLIAYTIMYVVSGFLVDRWGTRKALALFVGWWSLANILHLFARTGSQLRVFQVLLGIGEPGNYTAAGRIASEWYPPKERATINGLVNAGSAVGAILAIPLVAWLALSHGWRYAFLVTGLLGFVWLIPWIIFFKLPASHSSITDAELNYIQSGQELYTPKGKNGLWNLIRRSDILGLALARFLSDPVWWFYLFWLPGFLQEQRNFTLRDVALFGWLPYLASDIGGVFGGWSSDRLIRFAGGPVKARLIPMTACALLMPVSLLVPTMQSRGWMIGILCLLAFAHMGWKTNLMTITNDIYPIDCIGTVSGLLMLGSGIGGFLFQGIIAKMAQNASYEPIFAMMGFLHPLALVICILSLRKAASNCFPLCDEKPMN